MSTPVIVSSLMSFDLTALSRIDSDVTELSATVAA